MRHIKNGCTYLPWWFNINFAQFKNRCQSIFIALVLTLTQVKGPKTPVKFWHWVKKLTQVVFTFVLWRNLFLFGKTFILTFFDKTFYFAESLYLDIFEKCFRRNFYFFIKLFFSFFGETFWGFFPPKLVFIWLNFIWQTSFGKTFLTNFIWWNIIWRSLALIFSNCWRERQTDRQTHTHTHPHTHTHIHAQLYYCNIQIHICMPAVVCFNITLSWNWLFQTSFLTINVECIHSKQGGWQLINNTTIDW